MTVPDHSPDQKDFQDEWPSEYGTVRGCNYPTNIVTSSKMVGRLTSTQANECLH